MSGDVRLMVITIELVLKYISKSITMVSGCFESIIVNIIVLTIDLIRPKRKK